MEAATSLDEGGLAGGAGYLTIFFKSGRNTGRAMAGTVIELQYIQDMVQSK